MRLEYKDVKLEILQGCYDNGHTALILVDPINMNPLAALTVNIGDFDFPADELAIKTWAENEEIAAICFQTGLFEDTGKRTENGKVTIEFWKIKKPYTLDQFPIIKR